VYPLRRSLYLKDHFFYREWINLSILAIFFIVAIVVTANAPRFNGDVVTGLDEFGNPLTYGSVFGNLILMPLIALLMYVVLLAIPYIAVYKRNVQEFFDHHFGFKIIVLLFLFVIYITMLLPVFGMTANQNYFLIPALSAMLFYIGHLLRHVHRNYFFGIRTPWTLARDDVWNKTHKFGSAVFEICAVLLLLGLIWQNYFLHILLTTVIGGALICVVYSYLLFSRKHV
jgi:uncharacterized membrane protein